MYLNKTVIAASLISGSIITGVIVSPSVNAFEQQSFPSCLNPQGKIIAQYSDGTHGVPGNNNTFTGNDSVYILSSSSVVQCLCPENGQGIQTNWMKASDLSESEMSILENQGWIYIPSGAVWGLDDDPYLAQNMNFSCTASSNNAQTVVSSSQNSNNSSGNQNSGNSSPSNSSSSSPSVQGASTSNAAASTQQVLGLAGTGNIIMLYVVLILGTLFIGIGMMFKGKGKAFGSEVLDSEARTRRVQARRGKG